MLGGTGTNFFAGSTKANADNAPFRVDNAGNLYASNAKIEGKVITGTAAAQPGSYEDMSLVSLKGLYVNDGGILAKDEADTSSSSSNALNSILSIRGNAEGGLSVGASSGGALTSITAESSDSGHGTAKTQVFSGGSGTAVIGAYKDSTNNFVEIGLYGDSSNAKITRKVSGSGSSEHILSSSGMKHIEVVTQANYPQNPDPYTIYLVTN